MKISYEQAKADLLELANERPDYVYVEPGDRGCVYFVDNQPSCIVGHVLNKHGVSRDDLEVQYESYDGFIRKDDLNFESDVDDLIARGLLDIDDKTRVLLQGVQRKQDAKRPWKEAVNNTIAAVENEEEDVRNA